MSWELALLGIGISVVLMLPLAIKWKLPRKPTFIGIVAVSVAAALLFYFVYGLFDSVYRSALVLLGQIGLALGLGFALARWRFWRDPEREPLEKDGVVLSAADGKVIYVRTIAEGSTPMVSKSGRDYLLTELTGTDLLSSNAHIIAIEMSLLDVHVNRCPISGRVRMLEHIQGRYMSLGKDEAPFLNARLTTIIENSSMPVAVVQVASRLVRRVEGYLDVGEKVSAGQRLGMIRFGSLVAVVLPKGENVHVVVKPGDFVAAGITVLARYPVEDEEETA
jgi:phosphatidylserine decarboxylase